MRGMRAQGAHEEENEQVCLARIVWLGIELLWTNELRFVGWCNLRRGDMRWRDGECDTVLFFWFKVGGSFMAYEMN